MTSNMLDLNDEAKLPSSLEFGDYVQRPCKNAFLTGGTGFFGIHLLAELLRATNMHVWCLVRAKEEAEAYDRLCRQFTFYRLWEERFRDRITPVPGDLAQPAFALTEARFQALADSIDIIYHSGAYVNFLRPYHALKAANVEGTKEILRLAGLGYAKPVHYISTTALFFTRRYAAEERILETDIPPDPVNLKNGYARTKWVMEALMREAQQRGLPVAAYRAPGILANSQTGIIANTDDPWWVLIKACIQLGQYPDLFRPAIFVPVDYMSRAVLHISQCPGSASTKFQAFYTGNPGELISWQAMFEQIRALGYPLREVTYAAWREAIRRQADHNPKNKLFSLLTLLLNSVLFQPKPIFDARLTRQYLLGTGIHCPPVDKTLLQTYLCYMQEIGAVDAPAG
ncbi:MAG: NAD-dependent epimerase/dehydratase family protein [Gammaproteobacteria bacterium]|nr:NAD-dependent epimerase/dehydratase family protein [Gammaproteobacteria bacterium]